MTQTSVFLPKLKELPIHSIFRVKSLFSFPESDETSNSDSPRWNDTVHVELLGVLFSPCLWKHMMLPCISIAYLENTSFQFLHFMTLGAKYYIFCPIRTGDSHSVLYLTSVSRCPTSETLEPAFYIPYSRNWGIAFLV